MILSVFKKACILPLFIILIFRGISFAQETASFRGKINANNINIRSDSTVNAKVICNVNKGDGVDIILELYGWYKIKLPKTAPAFIKKDLAVFINKEAARVVKDKINIRLYPSESSPIIGEAIKDEIVIILEDKGEWYRIEPTDNSFGWVHKKFVNIICPEETPTKEKAEFTKEIEEASDYYPHNIQEGNR
jgi:uncharacterized protein YgiM (DUF1202 family)